MHKCFALQNKIPLKTLNTDYQYQGRKGESALDGQQAVKTFWYSKNTRVSTYLSKAPAACNDHSLLL